MPNIHFAKNIANIFNNYNLSETAKFDQCCKIVCEMLGANSVSLFMYNAQEDALTCNGNCISPLYLKYVSNVTNLNEIFHSFIKDVNIYNYLAEGRKKVYSEYIYHSGAVSSKKEEEKFRIAVMKWEESIEVDKIRRAVTGLRNQNVQNYIAIFNEYNNLIHRESYFISEEDNETITGNFFFNLINNSSSAQEIIKKRHSTWQEQGKDYFKLLEELGVNIPNSDIKKFYYIGSALYANDRYSGILRIIIDESKIAEQDFDERISNISQIISLHLKANFYLKVYRTLASMTLYKGNSTEIEDESLNNVSEIVVNILQCRGAIIRLGEANNYPSLKGKNGNSKSLQEYMEYVKLNEENNLNAKNFSKDIFDIFSDDVNGNVIKAVQFSINADNSNLFKTKEYFFVDDKLKNRVKTRTVKDFDFDYINNLRRFKIHEFVFVRLDDLDGGVMWFSNTLNRKFIRSDVEIILTISKSISLEITPSQHQKRSEEEMVVQKNQAVDSATGEWMNVLLHQVGQVITSSTNVIAKMTITNSNLFKKRNFTDEEFFEIEKPQELVQRIRLLGFLVNHAKRQINRSIIMRDIVNNTLKETNSSKKIPDIWKNLKNKCIDFDTYAAIEKNLHVWLSTPKEEIPISIITYEGLLDEAIFCLIDNAIKYSFHADILKSKYAEKIKFEEYSYNSEGHISISYTATLTKIEICVTNWGLQFKEEEKEKIFEKNYRGSNKYNSVGTGIGLYLVKKIMNFLNGDVTVLLYPRNKTAFKLTLNK